MITMYRTGHDTNIIEIIDVLHVNDNMVCYPKDGWEQLEPKRGPKYNWFQSLDSAKLFLIEQLIDSNAVLRESIRINNERILEIREVYNNLLTEGYTASL